MSLYIIPMQKWVWLNEILGRTISGNLCCRRMSVGSAQSSKNWRRIPLKPNFQQLHTATRELESATSSYSTWNISALFFLLFRKYFVMWIAYLLHMYAQSSGTERIINVFCIESKTICKYLWTFRAIRNMLLWFEQRTTYVCSMVIIIMNYIHTI